MKSSSVLSPLLSLLFFWAAPDSFARSDFVRGPEVWLEFMGGNVARDGFRKDLEAISRAGISGVHFRGAFLSHRQGWSLAGLSAADTLHGREVG